MNKISETIDSTCGNIKVSEELSDKIMNSVKSGHRKSHHRSTSNISKAWKIAIAAASVVCMFGVGTTAYANIYPQQFESLFNTFFGKTNPKYYDEKLSTVLNENSENINTIISNENINHYVTSAYNDYTMISVEDMYLDGTSLYYTLKMSTTNEKIMENDTFYLTLRYTKIYIGEDSYNLNNQWVGGVLPVFRKTADGEYVAVCGADLTYIAKLRNYDMPSDDMDMELHIDRLGTIPGSSTQTGSVVLSDAGWDMNFPVRMTTEDYRVTECNYNVNGYILENVVSSKADSTITLYYPVGEEINVKITDGNGNNVNPMSSKGEHVDYDGHEMMRMTLTASMIETDTCHIEIIKRDVSGRNTCAEYDVAFP